MGKNTLKTRYEKRSMGSTRAKALDLTGKDVTFWKPVKGKNYIHILPYKIATKDHQLVRSGDCEIGDDDFVLDLWVHQYVGPSKADVVCPNRNYGKACPICEAGSEYREQGKDKEAEKCRPTHKAIYNIVDESDNRNKGVQIFVASHKNFQEELMDEAGECGEDGEILDFYDFKKGKLIGFRAEEEFFNKKTYFTFKSFKFEKREEPLDPSLLEDVLDLDKYIVKHSYDEIKSIFYGEDEDDDIEVEGQEEEEQPKKGRAKREEVEEEDDEDKEEEAPKAKKAPKAKEEPEKEENPCPYGHVFGKDCGEFDDDCDFCEKWDECFKEKKALKSRK